MDSGAALTDLREEYAEKLRLASSSSGRVAFLRFCRTTRVGEAARILEVGRAALSAASARWTLGDEYWSVLEQLCVASLTEGDIAAAEEECAALAARFPESARVQRLVGLILEAKGEWDEAIHTYDALLEANPANSLAWKRKARRGGSGGVATRPAPSPLRLPSSDSSRWRSRTHEAGQLLR